MNTHIDVLIDCLIYLWRVLEEDLWSFWHLESMKINRRINESFECVFNDVVFSMF